MDAFRGHCDPEKHTDLLEDYGGSSGKWTVKESFRREKKKRVPHVGSDPQGRRVYPFPEGIRD